MTVKLSVIKNWSAPSWWGPSFSNRYEYHVFRKIVKRKVQFVLNANYHYQLFSFVRRLIFNKLYKEGRLKCKYPPKPPFRPRKFYRNHIRKISWKISHSVMLPTSPKVHSIIKGLSFRRRFVFTRFGAKKRLRVTGARHMVKIKPAVNNVFINLTYRDKSLTRRIYKNKKRIVKNRITSKIGKTIKISTTGLAGFKGPKRSSYLAAEEAGRLIGLEIKRRKIKQIAVVFHSGKNKKSIAALKGVLDRRLKNRASSYTIYPAAPHSKGLRKRKPRRV